MAEERTGLTKGLTAKELLHVDVGSMLILGSILISLVLLFTGDYLNTCGWSFEQILITLMAYLISITIYQYARVLWNRFRWLALTVAILINLFFGLMLYGTVC